MNRTLSFRQLFKQLLIITVPLLLNLLLRQMYHVTDAAVVSRLAGTTAFAALGVAGTIVSLFTFVLDNYCIKMSAKLARIYGTRDPEDYKQKTLLALLSGIVLSLLVGIGDFLLLPLLLKTTQTPAHLIPDIEIYVRWIAFGLLFVFLSSFSTNLLTSLGDGFVSLISLFASTILNLLLDLWFVGGLGLGVAGAAITTLLSQGANAAVNLMLLYHRHPVLRPRRLDFVWDPAQFWANMRSGRHSAITELSAYIGKLSIQTIVNTFGTTMISAFTAGTRFQDVAKSFGDAIEHGLSIQVGQLAGQKQGFIIRRALYVTLITAALLSLLLLAITALNARWFVLLFFGTTSHLSLPAAEAYITALAFSLLFFFLGSALEGFLRGLGDFDGPFYASLIQVIVWVGAAYLLIPTARLENIAYSWGGGWAVALLFLWLRYHREEKELIKDLIQKEEREEEKESQASQRVSKSQNRQ